MVQNALVNVSNGRLQVELRSSVFVLFLNENALELLVLKNDMLVNVLNRRLELDL